jgi:hypothetical protein
MSIKYKGHICVSNMQNINWMKSQEKRLLQAAEAM